MNFSSSFVANAFLLKCKQGFDQIVDLGGPIWTSSNHGMISHHVLCSVLLIWTLNFYFLSKQNIWFNTRPQSAKDIRVCIHVRGQVWIFVPIPCDLLDIVYIIFQHEVYFWNILYILTHSILRIIYPTIFICKTIFIKRKKYAFENGKPVMNSSPSPQQWPIRNF